MQIMTFITIIRAEKYVYYNHIRNYIIPKRNNKNICLKG